ncbi:MAG: hypothetical protein NZ954_00265 [Thermofilaceae archaeon]|nr:hypothetical protein [Thermofilaceae archaeon]MCX8180386.1 hypothetical protein [Thermofilaceae archaeon]MDW8003921.1 D-aminoacyl-tRNA deacylase [Thermofilaceae archaeon]
MNAYACAAYCMHDPAGVGVANELLKSLSYRLIEVPRAKTAYYITELDAILAGFEDDVLYFEFLDEVCEVEFYIVLSRHSSEAGIRSLTVHHPGNPMREAKAGGKPLELSPSNPPLAKQLLLYLVENSRSLPGFDVTYEVTHHGPSSLKKPVTFVEIGSSIQEWSLPASHKAVAEAVIQALSNPLPPNIEPVVGVGGNHYAAAFTSRALSSNEAYGHIIANYALKSLEEPSLVKNVLFQAVTRSYLKTQKIVVEKKLRKAWRDAAESVAAETRLEIEYI